MTRHQEASANTANDECHAKEVKRGWQVSKTTLKERVSFLLCNELFADVHFLLGKDGDRVRIPAHKLVLSIGSMVFDAMFNGSFKGTSEIELPDVEPTAFKNLLRCVYTDEIMIDNEHVVSTLYAAKKYDIQLLEKACVAQLKKSLCAENAFALLAQARHFDDKVLEDHCIEQIDKHTIEALASPGFTDIDRASLSSVLSRDSLTVGEVDLFKALCRWSEAECTRRGDSSSTPEQQRAAIGDLMNLIRFPLMAPQEFANGPAKSGILTDAECNSLFMYFFHATADIPYVGRPRHSREAYEMVISRFPEDSVGAVITRECESTAPDTITFSVDRDIHITAFGLHGSRKGPCVDQVTIRILQGTGKVLAEHSTSIANDGSGRTFKVPFPVPVEISKRFAYKASAHIKLGNTGFFGKNGLQRVVHPSGSPIFSFQKQDEYSSIDQGQIPEIYFYT